jgi:hypothetical protein
MTDLELIGEIRREGSVTKRTGLLVKFLKQLSNRRIYDPEEAHLLADDALLAFIGKPEVTEAFNAFEKWYA